MTHRDAFLRDILANPDDDAVRLIYADWLDDNGDAPRAEFIRAQCRAEALQSYEPERFDLEDRAADLLHAHRNQWVTELPPWARDKAQFCRGFVEEVQIDPLTWDTQTEELFKATPLRGVEVDVGYGRAGELSSLGHLDRVRELKLRLADHSGDSGGGLRQLLARPDLGWLRVLSLREFGGGTSHFLELLAANPASASLRSLLVHYNWERSPPAAPGHLEGMTALRELDLSNHGWGDAELAQLAAGPVLGRLTHLALGRSREPTPAGWEALLRAPGLGNVRALALTGCTLGGLGAALAECPALPGLRELRLGHTSLQRADVLALARSPHLGNLRRLDLDKLTLGEPGVLALAGSLSLRRLTVLSLSGAWVTARGVAALAASPVARELRVLDLGHIDTITHEGVKALARSPGLSNLRRLNIGYATIQPGTLRELAASPYLKGLTRLHLPHRRWTAADVECMLDPANFPRLRELSMLAHGRDDLGEDLLRRFRERFRPASGPE